MAKKPTVDNMIFIQDMLVRVDLKQDGLNVMQSAMNVELTRQGVILEEHKRRSIANEAAVEELKAYTNRMQGIGAFIALTALVASIWAAIK